MREYERLWREYYSTPEGYRRAAARAELDAHVRGLVEENERLREAMGEIVKGEGPYSRDPLTHASNVIEAMTKIARAALTTPKDAP